MADAPHTIEVDATPVAAPANPAMPAVVSALKAEGATGTADASGGDVTMSSGASTPVPTMEQQALSLKVSLADICAKGTAAYSHKEYEKAADLYAQAAEMQAEMNGEMSPDNAEILFLYGRSLFKVGQGKSDVLGGMAATTEGGAKPKTKKEPKAEKTEVAKKAAETTAKAEKEFEKEAEDKVTAKKPLFQFTGDENFDEDDSGEEGNEESEEDEEEEDDMGVAFEVLDLSRVLFNKRLQAATEGPDKETENGKGVAEDEKPQEISPELKHVKERLADTHDLLTEISWENERYAQSVTDARKSLEYKKGLYGEDNEIVAEAHYKVSLALEFASVTQTEEDAKEAGGASAVDEELREEAADELENAIRCTKLNLENKEVELATSHAPEENEVTRSRITEVKELIAEMEQRLEDLRKPPIDINAAIASGTGAAGGLLGALASGASGSAKEVEEAKKNATDLSGLVRKKGGKKESAADTALETASNGTSNGTKRKAEEPAAEEEDSAKKVKVAEEEPAAASETAA
ncbi:hypothetical protein MKZ38_003833 [Zalerion maritima]|uniref:Tetratricopeptide SHNi-TPR domain-containing protein n=1 Tax=Zalerion maritima TaxID=339359 RepID=A0AAD5WRG1_9PEZI|nr:hypothetical protein MKZ38_003833 [Zalerion maritima]